ncbi:hypothetical protein AWV79_35720 [Cupriavidus sp. UYMMa02A]|nr:hypothetical protein AWV79_35720 [Cupriavidus sp. UYMMa02A]
MLGVIGDIGQALVSSVSKGGQFTVNNTAGGAQQAMSEALRATINIPPTLETNQARTSSCTWPVILISGVSMRSHQSDQVGGGAPAPSTLDPKSATLLRYLNDGLGEFFNDPSITEIAINYPKVVFTESNAGWVEHHRPKVDIHYCLNIAKLSQAIVSSSWARSVRYSAAHCRRANASRS